MRRTLPTRRESKCNPHGDPFPCNEEWIRDGRLSDKDPLPWLRAVQVQGFELTVIGSTVDAVRVCVESWNAGFKPVLIIMEDQIAPTEDEEVRRMMYDLLRAHGGHGMFTYGPTVLYSDSSKCLVQLDEKGRAVDVCVCTNFGGLNSLAETWQLFKGPAIIVDPIGVSSEDSGKEDESGRRSLSVMVHDSSQQKEEPPAPSNTADDKRRLFLSRVKQERSAVVDPTFWEDRYDPERLSCWSFGYNEVLLGCFTGMVFMFLNVGSHRWFGEPWWPVLRAVADFPTEALCGNAFASIYLAPLGLHVPNNLPTRISLFTGLLYWFLNAVPMFLFMGSKKWYASEFICSFVALNTCYALFPLFAKFVKRVKVSKWMFLWYTFVLIGTVGTWVASIIILLIYLIILSSGRGVIASIFLTLAFSGWELFSIKLQLFGYDKMVWKPRKDSPASVLGDQKFPMAVCICMIHSFTEVGRLVCMVVGSVRAENVEFIGLVVVSTVSGLCLNVLARSGWLSCGLAHFARGFPRQVLCPTAVTGQHTDAKFALGWPRFFLLFGILLGRGVIHNRWKIPSMLSTPGSHQVWCWNGVVLISTALVFAQEVLEDYLVFVISQRAPAPFWATFKNEMLVRFDKPFKDDIYHPSHFLVPQTAFLAPSADSRSVPSLTGSEVTKRISKASSRRSEMSKPPDEKGRVTRISKIQDLAPKLSVSPNFKSARYVPIWPVEAIMAGEIVMMLCCVSIGLGNCSLFGRSEPIEMNSEAPVKMIQKLFIWDSTCQAD